MRTIALILCLCFAPMALAQTAKVSRVVRTFDFEERSQGNPEDQPMNWLKVEGPTLPHYVNGRLTTDRAHGGEYSFRMDLDGGGCLYRYQPGQLRVRPGANYRVEGFVQTTHLTYARARLTAYFTDLDGHPIPGTVAHSELYAGAEGQWKKLSIELTAGDARDAYLVLEMGLLQPEHYAPPSLGKRTLFNQDIHGTAWFDDISVAQVPQVIMSTDKPGNIFRRSEGVSLSVLVNDRFTDDLAGKLVVRDATGKPVYQHSGALDISAAEELGPGRKRLLLNLPEVGPGWYTATLIMLSQGQYVGEQSLDFVKLADDAPRMAPDPRFGIIATDLPFEGWSELPDLLPFLSAGRVKLAVWSNAGDAQKSAAAGFDQLLERLQRLDITPTACLIDLPPEIAEKIGTSNWLGLLKADREQWQPQLAYLIARHVAHLDRWQLGADGSDEFVTNPKMREVYDLIYNEFSNLDQKPDLAMPWPAWYDLSGKLPATVALCVPGSVLPSNLPLYIQDLRRNEEHNLSLTLEPLERDTYGRETQVRDFAQRIIYALSADARRIDVPLPFKVHIQNGVTVKDPQELLIVLRTLITTLSGAQFRGKMPVAENVEAFLFDRNGEGILALWDKSGVGDRTVSFNLGDRPVLVDLYGNATQLVPSVTGKAGQVDLLLGAMPVFLVNIDGQLAQLRASVAFDRPLVESSFEPHTRKLQFVNPYKQSISGSIKLRAPAGWTINPPTFTFSLNPGEMFDREVTMEFPYNSFAGPKSIEAEFVVQADKNSSFTVPIALSLGLSDVGMQSLAIRDGKDVVVQQMVTNYGEKPIDYTAFAIYPGQARQERLVTNLGAGRTTIKKYRFMDVHFTDNGKVRVGVKQIDGSRILNDEIGIQ
jgi:hypothetical protein